MSVIFQTLQKLKHPANGNAGAPPVSRRRRKTCSVSRAFLPLGIIVGIGVGLLVFFLWGFWGMDHISDGKAFKKGIAGQDSSGARAKEKMQVHIPKRSEFGENDATPPPPNVKRVQATKGKLYLPPSTPEQDRKKAIARYLPPIPEDRSSLDRVEGKQDLHYESPSGNHGGEKGGDPVSPAFAGTIMPERKHTKRLAPSTVREDARKGAAKGIPGPRKKREAAKMEAASERVRQDEQEPDGGNPREEIRTAMLPQGQGKSMEQGETSPPKGREKMHMSTVDRSAQVTLLVARVQQAMRAGDGREVQDLLGRLESLKGKGDDYLMRLKAFWYLKEGKYVLARSFLQQLISKNENDLEAGINMAILDIKTNHVEAARRRLRALRRLHEENTMIPALLEKISR